MLHLRGSYPSADTASAGGDLEVSVKVFDGSTGEETLHHQQDSIDEEGRGDAVDHILDDINPAGEIKPFEKVMQACNRNSLRACAGGTEVCSGPSSLTSLCHSHGEDVQSVHRAPHHLKVVLEDGDGAGQGFMPAAAEEGHACIQEDRGYEGRVRDPPQAFDAALQATFKAKTHLGKAT